MLDFDLNIIVVGQNSIVIEELLPFAGGAVTITLPENSCENGAACTNIAPRIMIHSCSSNIDFTAISDDGCDSNPCQNDARCMNQTLDHLNVFVMLDGQVDCVILTLTIVHQTYPFMGLVMTWEQIIVPMEIQPILVLVYLVLLDTTVQKTSMTVSPILVKMAGHA